MESTGESRNKSKHLWSPDISTRVSRLFNGKRMVSSTDGNKLLNVHMQENGPISQTIHKNFTQNESTPKYKN